MARVMAYLMQTSGAETLSVAANVFMGQTEAPLIVKPYVPRMTNSELFALMVSGFAHISGAMMFVYINYGADPTAVLTTCVMACPCSLYLANLSFPELETPETGGKLISQMSPNDIRGAYVLYIGAGAVAAGGIISLLRSIRTIWHGLRGGLADLLGHHGPREHAPRTDRDLSMRVVIGGCLLIIAIIMAVPQLNLRGNLLGAFLIVLFGFIFVTVSSRLTGEIGSSSNPISGMTVATLLLTCLVFLIVGWTGPHYFVTALSIGGIVCIAASNGGTTSQGFEDRVPGWIDTEISTDRDPVRRTGFRNRTRTNPVKVK